MKTKSKLTSASKSLTTEYAEEESLLTKEQLAEFLQVSVKMIDKMVSLHDIPFLKVGSLVRFSKKAVIESMSTRQSAG